MYLLLWIVLRCSQRCGIHCTNTISSFLLSGPIFLSSIGFFFPWQPIELALLSDRVITAQSGIPLESGVQRGLNKCYCSSLHGGHVALRNAHIDVIRICYLTECEYLREENHLQSNWHMLLHFLIYLCLRRVHLVELILFFDIEN